MRLSIIIICLPTFIFIINNIIIIIIITIIIIIIIVLFDKSNKTRKQVYNWNEGYVNNISPSILCNYSAFENTFLYKLATYRNQSSYLLCKSVGWFLYGTSFY